MSTQYTPDEVEVLSEALRGGSSPHCPRCGTTLDKSDVPPRDDVPYVRNRIWLVCGGCGRSAVLDRRAVSREAG